MSNSNTFTHDLPQTTIKDAYFYQTFSPYVATQPIFQPKYSSMCVFCSHNETKALMNDGSFRQCNRCNKQFRATITK
jgi:hypothetical protein